MFDPRPLCCSSLTTAVGGTKDTNIVDSESPYRGTNHFRYAREIPMHSEIAAPMFFEFLMPNDPVLMYYHFGPYVISYFRYFSSFTLWVVLYKPPQTCNPRQLFIFIKFPATFILGFHLLSSLSSFFHFLGCQTLPLRMTTQGMLG